jgi:alpha-1,3-rhamnosyl/mannosyltransferase
MPLRNPYASARSSYGPRHLDREAAARFWNSDDLESALGFPQIVHANNFWCPLQLRSTRLVYTLYDLGFLIDPAWSTEANRIGCFDGVFRAALEADWIVAISRSSRDHYLATFPHFPAERIRVIHPCSRFAGTVPRDRRSARLDGIKPGEWLSVGTIEPRKNQATFARLPRVPDRGAATLVLAGGTGWNMRIFRAISRSSSCGQGDPDRVCGGRRACFAVPALLCEPVLRCSRASRCRF